MLDGNEVVIKYEITGHVDGRWVIQAFDYKGRKLGTRIEVGSEGEARAAMEMLEGPTFWDDLTEEIQTEEAA